MLVLLAKNKVLEIRSALKFLNRLNLKTNRNKWN
ncbi:hypothetical protein SAMN05444146_2135 [Flavobacterium johnsoniae]|nr:hypothetical protein SAMN05444146_2135 [Flavobacterium johnsoniae]